PEVTVLDREVIREKDVILPLPEKLPEPKGEKGGLSLPESTAATAASTVAKSATDSGTYYQRIEKTPLLEFVNNAHRALEKLQHSGGGWARAGIPRPSGGSLFEIVSNAAPATPAPMTLTAPATATAVPMQSNTRLEPVAVGTPNVQKPLVNPGIVH